MTTARLWQAVRRVLSALWLALRWTARRWRWLLVTTIVGGVLSIMERHAPSTAVYWSIRR